MGRHLTQALLLNTDAEITLLNRGKTPCPFTVDNQRLFLIKCDRFDRKAFRNALRTGGGRPTWDYVVDFLCFKKEHAKDVVRALWSRGGEKNGKCPAGDQDGQQQQQQQQGHVKSRPSDLGSDVADAKASAGAHALKLYILISTDSVYMACRPPTHSTGMRECDDVRPESKTDMAVVAARDSYQLGYGGNKLKAEEFLRREFASSGFPFVALRLPDVVGPYDNLTGLLSLRRRLLRHKRIGLRIGACCAASGSACSGRTHRISVVFAPDVARVICDIVLASHLDTKWLWGAAQIEKVASPRDCICGHAFNIACKEMPTFEKIVCAVAAELKMDERTIRWTRKRDAPWVSVEMGPVDITRAQSKLNFKPTPLKTVLGLSMKWFEKSRHRKYTRDLDRSSSSSEEEDEEAPVKSSQIGGAEKGASSCSTGSTSSSESDAS